MQKNTNNDNLVRLKASIGLYDLATKQGIRLKKLPSGEYAGLCPFHDDKTPSLHINPTKNLFHCKGCNKGGSPVDWLMHRDKIDKGEALKLLQKMSPQLFETPPLKEKAPVSPSPNNETEATLITDISVQQILKRILDYFSRQVKNNSTALDYLKKRNLIHGELLEAFQVGYADNSFLQKLPSGKEGKQIKNSLKKIGFLTKSGKCLFQDMLVFPILSKKGEVLNIYGRRLKEKKNYANHMYLPGKRQGIFNLKAITASREVIICESIIDALSFWVNDFRNVSCAYGTNGFTEEMTSAYRDNSIEKVFIAYDNDTSGNEASDKLASLLSQNGTAPFRIEFPENLDANEYISRVKAPASNLKHLIQNALPMEKVISAKEENLFKGIDLSSKTSDIDWCIKQGGYIFTIGKREYQFYGVEKNFSYESLKVRVRFIANEKKYTDNGVDLFNHKTIKSQIKSASEKLEIENQIIEKDLDKIISILEEIQADIIDEKLNHKDKKEVVLTELERDQALSYLKDKDLIDKIKADFDKIGLVGESENCIIGYAGATSRHDDTPLAIIVQSSTGAGKTAFMDAVLSLMPEEDVIKFSALTDQSLYYMQGNLKHKILAIVEEEGAERASYSLKLLQSEGKISIASTGKDPESGKLETQTYEVEGPVMILIATTNCTIDEELKNRCNILTVNESQEQTKQILEYQRKMQTLAGLISKSEKQSVMNLHKNIQRLLRPIHVVNNFSEALSFTSKDHRSRRDQQKYLTLIRSIAFLHQYQREVKTLEQSGQTKEYIEVTLDDIELANKLAVKIFGVSLDDLPPQTRLFLEKLYDWVLSECKKQKIDIEDFRFTKRQAADALEKSTAQAGVHLRRLEDDDYVLKLFGKNGQANVYSLLYRGEGRRDLKIVLGLIDITKLRTKFEKKKGKKP